MSKDALNQNEKRIVASFSETAALTVPQLKACFGAVVDDGQRRVIQIFAMLPDELSIVSIEADKLRELAEVTAEKENYPLSLRCTHEPKGLYGKKEDYALMDRMEAGLHKQIRLNKRFVVISKYSKIYWIVFWFIFIVMFVYGVVVNTPR